ALSSEMVIQVAREGALHQQRYSRGHAVTKLEKIGKVPERETGTIVEFVPDTEIFGAKQSFSPKRIYKMARSKAYLYRGVEIVWTCAEGLLSEGSEVPKTEIIKFPNGILDFLYAQIEGQQQLTP